MLTDHHTRPSISIIIVNWHSKGLTRQCLTSIYRYCRADVPQIVVVDGGSFDGCGDMLAQEFPSTVFVQSNENVGFAKANNLGVRHCSGDLLFFLNPDTEFLENSSDILRKYIVSLPDAGIVGCTLLNTDHSVQTSCVQPFPTVLNQVLASEFLRRRLPRSRLWGMQPLRSTVPVEADAVIGACILVTRDIFNAVGGFTESYFMYGEDIDLCFKVRQAGYRVYHVPDTQIIHHGGGSTRPELKTSSNVMMRQSVYQFLRSNSGIASACAYRGAMAASAVVRIMIILLMGLVSRKRVTQPLRTSLRKWLAILRWSIGLPTAARA